MSSDKRWYEDALRDLPPIEPGDLVQRSLGRLEREAAPPARARRTTWPYWLPAAAAAVLLSTGVGLWLQRSGTPGEATSPEALARDVDPSGVVVRATTGAVELERAGVVGELSVATRLRPGDVVITGAKAQVTLHLGDAAAVVVDDHTQVRLQAVSGGVPELDVLRGRIEGSVPLGGESDRLAVASSSGRFALVSGKIGVLRGGAGTHSIAALSNAAVRVHGKVVHVPVNHLLHLPKEGEPARVEALPGAIDLSVRQARPLRPEERDVEISGAVALGVVVVLNQQAVPVTAAGEFVATVHLGDDEEYVVASAKDAAGRVTEQRLQIVRATSQVRWKAPG